MIKPRAVLEHANNQQQFIERAESNDLTVLTLDQLVERYNQIDQQSQLFKGLILLEARERFKSDKEFGQWIATVELFNSSRYSNANYMNLARFFKNKDMTGISITAAYEIAAPQNADIANEVYSFALLKNLPVAEIKRQIALKKGTIQTVFKADTVRIIPTDKVLITGKPIEEVETISTELVNEQTNLDLETRIMQVIENENPQIAIVALKNAIDKINAKRYGK